CVFSQSPYTASQYQKFTRFQFLGKTYQITCLPFGLSSAPRIYTKVLKPVVGTLRKMGVHLVSYLDDMLIMNNTRAGHSISGNPSRLSRHEVSPTRGQVDIPNKGVQA
ncbi:hypothetical protein QZH41_019696, partial [Actinostola sp. cb2023]